MTVRGVAADGTCLQTLDQDVHDDGSTGVRLLAYERKIAAIVLV